MVSPRRAECGETGLLTGMVLYSILVASGPAENQRVPAETP